METNSRKNHFHMLNNADEKKNDLKHAKEIPHSFLKFIQRIYCIKFFTTRLNMYPHRILNWMHADTKSQPIIFIG